MTTTTLTHAIRPPAPRLWPALVVAVVLGVVAALTPYAATFAILGGLAVVSALLLTPARDRYSGSLLAAFGVGLALRILTVFLLHAQTASPANPDGLLYRDAIGYNRVGKHLAHLFMQGQNEFRTEYHTTGTAIPFHYFIGRIYSTLGTSAWNAKFVTVLLGGITVLLTFRFARPLIGSKGAIWAAWIYALWPTAIFWSAQIMKDMLVGFILMVASLAWLKYAENRRLFFAILCVALVYPLLYLRIYVFGFLAIGVFFGLVFDAFQHRRVVWLGVLVFIAVFGWQVPFLLGWLEDPQVLLVKLSYRNDPTKAQDSALAMTTYNVGFGPTFFLALIRFMFSPIPWKATGPDLYTVPGVLLQYAIMPFAVRGGWLLIKHRTLSVLPFVVLTVLTNALYAVIYLGSIPRHMHMFYPYMFVCGVAGMMGWKHWVVPWCAFMACIFMGTVAIDLI